MSINGKQVKTAKITQIIPWFPRFYGKKLPATHSVATGHMCEQWPLHGDNAYLPTEVSGCGQLADGLKVGRRDISKF